MARDAATRLLRLCAGAAELAVAAGARQVPAIIHLGAALGQRPLPGLWQGAEAGSLLDVPTAVPLLPDSAAGWTGAPGWAGADAAAAWLAETPTLDGDVIDAAFRHPDGRQLRYRIEIFGEGLFAVRLQAHMGAATHGHDIALTLPLPTTAVETLAFSGRWAGELMAERRPLAGGHLQSSRAGSRTAHDAFPGFLAGSSGFDDDHGEVLALHLAWFGNYELGVSRARDGQFVARWALDLREFEPDDDGWRSLPTLFAAWSGEGLNGIRIAMQEGARRLRRDSGAAAPGKVQLNTWEGVYFRHDVAALKRMADAAADIGMERFVLDDGWFGRRTDDTRGLGDWVPRSEVYPDGLGELIDHVRAAGLEFGLWVEPEMVNADSALYQRHPEWILGAADQPLGRHQYALDLCQPACFDHLEQTLRELVADARIASLKWDMNRDVPQAAGRPLAAAAQRLIAAIKHARGDLEIEACASGGGRSDWSALAWCNRVWLSDAHDPDVRLPMMAAYSLFAPREAMGSHIGPETSHQTGRRFGLHARAAMAVLGSMGVELDPLTLDSSAREIVGSYVALHKRHRGWMDGGHLLVLPHVDANLTAVGVFSAARDRALICLLQRGTRSRTVTTPLRIRHLRGALTVRAPIVDRALGHGARSQPAWTTGERLLTDGEFLAAHGLPLPLLAPMRAVLVELLPSDE